ncbi:MAG: fibronectin type III domain-containing protein, partial [Planctomycetaceae bacterium]|nr:fibronectin type III domain-containing protein [Planctomycetaceae bacterium]
LLLIDIPDNLSATFDLIKNRFELHWDKLHFAVTYEVELSFEGNSISTADAPIDIGNNRDSSQMVAFIDTSGLIVDRTYAVRVRAVKDEKKSPWSQRVNVRLTKPAPVEVARQLYQDGVTASFVGSEMKRRFPNINRQDFAIAMRDGNWSKLNTALAMNSAYQNLTTGDVVRALLAAWPVSK